MARRSRMSILKRQRELKKAEKAARKRARRHGVREEGLMEPSPSIGAGELLGLGSTADDGAGPSPAAEAERRGEQSD